MILTQVKHKRLFIPVAECAWHQSGTNVDPSGRDMETDKKHYVFMIFWFFLYEVHCVGVCSVSRSLKIMTER